MTDVLPPLTDDELTAIEQAARAATPGPWELMHCTYPPNEKGRALWEQSPFPPFDRDEWNVRTQWIHGQANDKLCIAYMTASPYFEGPQQLVSMNEGDAVHIASADPQTVLRLVAEVRRLKTALAGQP